MALDESIIGKTCPFCMTPFKPDAEVVVCDRCGMPHHQDCWQENHGCTTFGCTHAQGMPAGSPVAPAPSPAPTWQPDIDLTPFFSGPQRTATVIQEALTRPRMLNDSILAGIFLLIFGIVILPYLATSSAFIAEITADGSRLTPFASFWKYNAPILLTLLAIVDIVIGILLLRQSKAARTAGVVLLLISMLFCFLPLFGLGD